MVKGRDSYHNDKKMVITYLGQQGYQILVWLKLWSNLCSMLGCWSLDPYCEVVKFKKESVEVVWGLNKIGWLNDIYRIDFKQKKKQFANGWTWWGHG